MVDFNKIKPKEIISKKLEVTLKLELNDSSYSAEDAASRVQSAMDSYRFKEFTGFILELLRITNSCTYELKSLEITDEYNK